MKYFLLIIALFSCTISQPKIGDGNARKICINFTNFDDFKLLNQKLTVKKGNEVLEKRDSENKFLSLVNYIVKILIELQRNKDYFTVISQENLKIEGNTCLWVNSINPTDHSMKPIIIKNTLVFKDELNAELRLSLSAENGSKFSYDPSKYYSEMFSTIGDDKFDMMECKVDVRFYKHILTGWTGNKNVNFNFSNLEIRFLENEFKEIPNVSGSQVEKLLGSFDPTFIESISITGNHLEIKLKNNKIKMTKSLVVMEFVNFYFAINISEIFPAWKECNIEDFEVDLEPILQKENENLRVTAIQIHILRPGIKIDNKILCSISFNNINDKAKE